MTALDHHPIAIDAGTRAMGAAARVASGFRSLVRALLNRREVNRLGYLSDHELADIGLMRSDLVVAMRTPLGSDPTVRLSQFARERISLEDGARRVC